MGWKKWTEDEVTVAIDYFVRMPEATHTDSHEKCISFAETIGRSPGAVDKTLRNIKSVWTGSAGLPNASATVRKLTTQFRKHLESLAGTAEAVREKHGWAKIV